MATIDGSTIDELKAKHGNVHVLTAGGHQVAVREPKRADWKKFRKLVRDGNPDAIESLFRDCLLHPKGPELEAMLEAKPALAEKFGDAVADLAGAAEVVEKNAA